MKEIYRSISKCLQDNEDIVLVYLIDHSGSTPRETGSRMIVHKDGKIECSIGGGKVEAVVIEKAMQLFETRKSVVESYSLTADDIAGLGMACGGGVIVFLQYIARDDEKAKTLCDDVLNAISSEKQAWLVTEIFEDGYGQRLTYESEDARFISRNTYDKEQKTLIEPITKISKAFIFGAGHISYELAPVLNRLGFHLTVIDDRDDFANKRRFPHADDILVCGVEKAFEDRAMTKDDYVVIVTRGHLFDQEVLEKALLTDVKYIGMIGSRSKVAMVKDNLKQKGFDELSRLHSPIGLSIKAHTPEEIAISIAAEMIMVRADG